VTQDPFAQPGASAPSGDPFGQPAGGGNFPKVKEMFGQLIMLTPREVVPVKDNFDKDGVKMKDRLTADLVVLTGDLAGTECSDMWWNQSPIVKSGEIALRKGVKMILGRLYRFPLTEDKNSGKWKDRHAIEQGLLDFRAGTIDDPPRFAWAMEQYDEADAQIARDYLAKVKSPF
jgi:hypothetical protein